MHILILTTQNILQPRFGGELRVSLLLNALAKSGSHASIIRFRAKNDPPAPSQSSYQLTVHDIVIPLDLPLPLQVVLLFFFLSQIVHLAERIDEINHIDVIQSDPLWVALAGLKIAQKLSRPHLVLSQNCESSLATKISRTGPARHIPIIGNKIADFNLYILQKTEKYVISKSNMTLTPSSVDRDEMVAYGIPVDQVDVLPNGTQMEEKLCTARFEVRRRLHLSENSPVALFMGRLDYPPNREAVNFISQHIAPKCPNVEFLVIGMNPPIIELPDNVRMLGFVDNIDEYLCASDLEIVPITFGSGTRIKILDAWAIGLPVLATSAAAAGLDYRNGENILIEDDVQKFSEVIGKVIEAKRTLATLKEGGLKVSRQYKWDNIGKQYLEKLSTLIGKKNHG